jgi:hypothetical protein
MGRTRRTMLPVVLLSPRLSSQTGGTHVSGGGGGVERNEDDQEWRPLGRSTYAVVGAR